MTVNDLFPAHYFFPVYIMGRIPLKMKLRQSLAVLKFDQSILFFKNSYGLGDHG